MTAFERVPQSGDKKSHDSALHNDLYSGVARKFSRGRQNFPRGGGAHLKVTKDLITVKFGLGFGVQDGELGGLDLEFGFSIWKPDFWRERIESNVKNKTERCC